MSARRRVGWNRTGGTSLPIRRILLAIAALLFLLAAFGGSLGTFQLMPLGLFFLALAFLL
jgi:hypothetical protein